MESATNGDTLKEIHLIYHDESKNVKITGFTLGETAPLKDDGGGGVVEEEVKEEEDVKDADNVRRKEVDKAAEGSISISDVVKQSMENVANTPVTPGKGGGRPTGTDGGSKRGGKKSRKPKSKRIRVRKTRRRKH